MEIKMINGINVFIIGLEIDLLKLRKNQYIKIFKYFNMSMYNSDAITLQNFVEQVFTGEPKEPRSYTLALDTDFTNTPDDLKTVFECLTTVFTMGMKRKYADNNGVVDLINVTPTQFQYMKDYFKSFGFEVMYEAKPHEQMRTDLEYTDDLPSLDEEDTNNIHQKIHTIVYVILTIY